MFALLSVCLKIDMTGLLLDVVLSVITLASCWSLYFEM
jgi:hypothetical protein